MGIDDKIEIHCLLTPFFTRQKNRAKRASDCGIGSKAMSLSGAWQMAGDTIPVFQNRGQAMMHGRLL